MRIIPRKLWKKRNQKRSLKYKMLYTYWEYKEGSSTYYYRQSRFWPFWKGVKVDQWII